MIDGIDYAVWRFWFDVLQTIALTVLAVYTWLVNRTKANRTAIGQVDQRLTQELGGIHHRLGQVSDRVTTVERDIRHLPDQQAIGSLHEKVNAIASSVGHMEGELSGLQNSVTLIHEHLLRGGRNG